MKKLNNKKGFTLIEMLVVIAIIAVLVAIIIPVVSSATDKAAAATNAANLRSIKAEATTDLLNGATNTDGYVSFDPTKTGDTQFKVNDNAPKAKKCGTMTGNETATIKMNGKNVDVYYGDYNIDDFALVAEKGGDLKHITTTGGGNQQGGGNGGGEGGTGGGEGGTGGN